MSWSCIEVVHTIIFCKQSQNQSRFVLQADHALVLVVIVCIGKGIKRSDRTIRLAPRKISYMRLDYGYFPTF